MEGPRLREQMKDDKQEVRSKKEKQKCDYKEKGHLRIVGNRGPRTKQVKERLFKGQGVMAGQWHKF